MNVGSSASVAFVGAVLLATPAQAADTTIATRHNRVVAVGGVPVPTRYGPVIERWGYPTNPIRGPKQFCVYRWAQLSVRMVFRATTESGACKPGQALKVNLEGDQWRTIRGLRVGDPTSRIPKLYPSAFFASRGLWVIHRGDGRGLLRVEAEPRDGRIAAFVVELAAYR